MKFPSVEDMMQPPDGITCDRCGSCDSPVIMEAGRAKCSIRDGRSALPSIARTVANASK